MHHQEVAREFQFGDDGEFPLDLGVGARCRGPRPVPLRGTDHDQFTQPAVLGVTLRNVERRKLRRDQRQLERALLAEIGGCADGLRVLGEQPGHLRAGPQMRPAHRCQPAGRGIQGLPGPDRRHRRRQPAPAGFGEVRPGGGHHAHPESWRQLGQRGVALVVEGVAVVSELDADPAGAEPVHQVG